MTLILSVITPTYVMQASDRRVVALDGSDEVVSHWDDRNKAIFVVERMTFAYTGHADIAGTDTAEFFQARIGSELERGASIDAALQVVGVMCAEYLRSLPESVNRAHAFVGVGWSPEPKLAKRTPFLTGLSNSLDHHGNWRHQPAEQFTSFTRTLTTAERFALHVAGRFDRDAQIRLNALLDSHFEDSDDPVRTAKLLIDAIREQSAQDDAVGPGVMVNTLPIVPEPPDQVMLVAGPPERDARTFTYIPEGSFEGVFLGPLVVGSGGVQMGEFRARGGPGGLFNRHGGGATGMSYSLPDAPPPPRSAVGQRIRVSRPGRNDPCWCGSDKKFKKCHGP